MTETAVHRFFALGAKGDLDGAWDCFTGDGVWITPDGDGPGTVHRGPEIREHLARMDELGRTIREQGLEGVFEEPVFLVNGTQAIVEWSMRTIDGGVVVERGIDLFTLRDGKIAVKDVFRKA